MLVARTGASALVGSGSRWRAAWTRRKARAFPPGAITFHIPIWTHGRRDPDDAREVESLLSTFGQEEFLILHGNALRFSGRVVLVVGPSGTEKSTASRSLVRRGLATLVEDGLLLVGVAAGQWTLLETGTLGVLRRVSLVSKVLRSVVTPIDAKSRQAGNGAEPPYSTPRIDGLAFRLGVLLTRPPGRSFKPRLAKVDALVIVEPQGPFSPAFRVSPNDVSPVADLTALAPEGTVVTRLDSSVPRPVLRQRLLEALLASAAGPEA